MRSILNIQAGVAWAAVRAASGAMATRLARVQDVLMIKVPQPHKGTIAGNGTFHKGTQ